MRQIVVVSKSETPERILDELRARVHAHIVQFFTEIRALPNANLENIVRIYDNYQEKVRLECQKSIVVVDNFSNSRLRELATSREILAESIRTIEKYLERYIILQPELRNILKKGGKNVP